MVSTLKNCLQEVVKIDDSFTIRHNGIKILNRKLKTGFTKFNVPGWEVRTFDYEPGLPGEFQLNAMHIMEMEL